jgi:hypothetical protein
MNTRTVRLFLGTLSGSNGRRRVTSQPTNGRAAPMNRGSRWIMTIGPKLGPFIGETADRLALVSKHSSSPKVHPQRCRGIQGRCLLGILPQPHSFSNRRRPCKGGACEPKVGNAGFFRTHRIAPDHAPLRRRLRRQRRTRKKNQKTVGVAVQKTPHGPRTRHSAHSAPQILEILRVDWGAGSLHPPRAVDICAKRCCPAAGRTGAMQRAKVQNTQTRDKQPDARASVQHRARRQTRGHPW